MEKELFAKYYGRAEQLMEEMTLEEKVSQMFLARYPNTNVDEQIIAENPGGYILFGNNFKDQTVESMSQKLMVHQSNSKTNMFFAVDEEGGTVCRISSHEAFRAQRFHSPQKLFSEGGMGRILKDSKEKSDLLTKIGINVNLAPVVDIPTDTSSFMYQRSFGKGAEETAEYAGALIQQMNKQNMISCMKHFPGYGNNVDTHTGIAVDERKLAELKVHDFLPFQKGIQVGAPMIMVNHNIIHCIDEIHPASLSANVHQVLRDLGFTGIICTDDLKMDAVKEYAENGEAAVQAVLSGNDVIISSNFVLQKQELLRAVKNKKISEMMINTAVRRILACKCRYGIIE